MPIPYDGNWFYPPRSSSRMPYNTNSPVLRMWKKFPDAVAQYKMNGTNCQLKVFPDHRTIELWSRHKEDEQGRPTPTGTPQKIRNYTLPSALAAEVLSFTPKGVYTVYNVELMHAKTTMVKNVLYFFDVLVWQGMHLLDVDYAERYRIIADLLARRFFPLDLPNVDGKLYIANNIEPCNWDEAWRRAAASPYCEGLVLKRTGAVSRLQVGNREDNNGGFLCRIRKPHKNAEF
jgi:ATP-dependent DNA ligase